jgi:hypothetical protein
MDPLKKLLGYGTPHRYKTETLVARLNPGEDESARKREAEDLLILNPTPGPTTPATEGGTKNKIPLLGTVSSTVQPQTRAVINATEDDHLLAPGTVTSTIEQRGNKLYAVRDGEGSGILPRTNVWMAGPLWNLADQRITRGMNPEYAADCERAHEHVMSRVDMNDPDGSFLAGWQGINMTQAAYQRHLG